MRWIQLAALVQSYTWHMYATLINCDSATLESYIIHMYIITRQAEKPI